MMSLDFGVKLCFWRDFLYALANVQGVTKERAIGIYLKFLMSPETEPINFVCLLFTVYSYVAHNWQRTGYPAESIIGDIFV